MKEMKQHANVTGGVIFWCREGIGTYGSRFVSGKRKRGNRKRSKRRGGGFAAGDLKKTNLE